MSCTLLYFSDGQIIFDCNNNLICTLIITKSPWLDHVAMFLPSLSVALGPKCGNSKVGGTMVVISVLFTGLATVGLGVQAPLVSFEERAGLLPCVQENYI